MDVVYILGNFSPWKHNEIRYSLRSLSQVNIEGTVYVIGYKPPFLGINHIPSTDPFKNKQQNAIKKILEICNTKEISEDFILMNDDFFFIRPQEIKNYVREKLEDMPQLNFKTTYGETLRNTYEWLKERDLPTESYEVHYPMIINKTKFKKLFESIDYWETPLNFRSIYGNYYKIPAEKTEDFKLRNPREFNEMNNNINFLSISDELARYIGFALWIKRKFPEPSKYELDKIK